MRRLEPAPTTAEGEGVPQYSLSLEGEGWGEGETSATTDLGELVTVIPIPAPVIPTKEGIQVFHRVAEKFLIGRKSDLAPIRPHLCDAAYDFP